MSTANTAEGDELVVAPDGSIPAEQISRLGLRPGAHLWVVATESSGEADSLAGALPDLPELSWEDFERASEAARHDHGQGENCCNPACGTRPSVGPVHRGNDEGTGHPRRTDPGRGHRPDELVASAKAAGRE